MRNLRALLLLPVLVLPLTAGTCTEEKDVDLVLGLPLEIPVDFTSTGGVNTHDDTGYVDLRDELDLAAELDDASIDPDRVSSIALVQVFYRITRPQAGRSLENGNLEIWRGSGMTDATFVPSVGPVAVASGFTADAGAVTGWIDITPQLQSGVAVLNDLAADLLTEVQGGSAASDVVIKYHVSGDSVPAAEATDIQWEIKLVIQVVGQGTFEVPFG